jgi:hypothetical protein
MKTVKFLFAVTFLAILSPSVNAQMAKTTGVKTQEHTMFSTSNSIELNGSSDEREIQVEVSEEGCNFSLDLNAEIKKGSIKIEIYDPKGKKRGSFSSGTIKENKIVEISKEEQSKMSSYQEQLNGRIMEQNASSGLWIIKIMPKNTHGRLMFRTQQNSTNN